MTQQKTTKSYIGKEDLRLFGGDSNTFQRRNSAGALVTYHTVGNTVDVLNVYGDGTTPAQVNLINAILGANGSECALELAPGIWPITSDLTVPSTVTLVLLRGATFSVSVGVTLTLSGPVIAQEAIWYSGAGTVVYTAGGGFFPLVSDLASVAVGKGAALIGATGTVKTVGDLFDGGKDVTIKPLNIDAGGTLDVAGNTTLAGNLSITGTLNKSVPFRGARVYKSGNQSLSNASETLVTWDSESYDTSTIHDNVTNNSRLTVPAGVTRVWLTALISFQANITGSRLVYLLKNNSVNYDGYLEIVQAATQLAGYKTNVQVSSPVLTVVAGNYFEIIAYQNSTGALNVSGGNEASWFALEVIE